MRLGPKHHLTLEAVRTWKLFDLGANETYGPDEDGRTYIVHPGLYQELWQHRYEVFPTINFLWKRIQRDVVNALPDLSREYTDMEDHDARTITIQLYVT